MPYGGKPLSFVIKFKTFLPPQTDDFETKTALFIIMRKRIFLVALDGSDGGMGVTVDRYY